MANDRINRLVEASVAIQREIWGETSFNHSLLCQVNLPYRNLGDDVRDYTRTSGGVSLRLEAGAIPSADGWKPVGLPYGPRARLLMLHLCSLAIKQQSPTVEVEQSFTSFCRALGIATNGRNLRTIRDQIDRMSAVSMRLAMLQKDELSVFQGPVFDGMRLMLPENPNQKPLWTSQVRFSPPFYESLKNHAVPLDLKAIQAIRHSARAIDIYCWLASRLWRIPEGKTVKVRWTSLKWQFGQPEQSLKSFKKAFQEAFIQARVVYPRARAEFVYQGVSLERSPPAIPKIE